MKLYVVRHAESVGNALDVIDDNSLKSPDTNHLSEKGKEQAKVLAGLLDAYTFDAVIVSPLKRTRETLEPYLRKHHLTPIISILTAERNYGVFIGKPRSYPREYCMANGLDRVSFRPEGGESILDQYERAKRCLSWLKESFNGKTVLICGHVNFLRCLDIAIKGLDIKGFYTYKGLENGEIREYEI